MRALLCAEEQRGPRNEIQLRARARCGVGLAEQTLELEGDGRLAPVRGAGIDEAVLFGVQLSPGSADDPVLLVLGCGHPAL